MSRRRVVVVAHPDDEVLFFGGTILRGAQDHWTLVCVTDGNGDGRAAERRRELLIAADELGVANVVQLDLPDELDASWTPEDLAPLLVPLVTDADEVLTHGPLGEYGHPHHRAVLWATSLAANAPVTAVAWNAAPDPDVSTSLTPTEFRTKQRILCTTYRHETSRFLGLLPATAYEGMRRISRWFQGEQPSPPSLHDPHWSALLQLDPRRYRSSFHAFLASYGLPIPA